MHPFNSPSLEKTQPFCGFSAFGRSPHFSNRLTKKTSWKNTTRLNFLLKVPFSTSPAISLSGKDLRISAHFGRASKRRNSLREKLVEEGKVRGNPDYLMPDPNLNSPNYVSDGNGITQLASDYINGDENVFIGSEGDDIHRPIVEKSNLLGESVLRSKLENWVDQYRKDSEYWGIGSGPIFTVFVDVDGNVNRVLVNEDEIIRRHKVGDIVDVNSKTARAKLIAKEIETGKYSFPKNSSIANFVIESNRSFAVNQFPSIALRGKLLPRFSWVGLAMMCGCFVVWALWKLPMNSSDGAQLTSMEKEMLRRKIRARMDREDMKVSDVDVLQIECVPESIERPQFDKDKLMKSILEAKASDEHLATLDSDGNIAADDVDFNDKILEIREMARQARELEQKDRSQHNKDEDEDAVSDIVHAVKVDLGILGASDDKKSNNVVNGLDSDNVSDGQLRVSGGVNEDLMVEMEDSKVDGLKGVGFQITPAKPASTNCHKADGRISFNETSADAVNSESFSNAATVGLKVSKNELKSLQDPATKVSKDELISSLQDPATKVSKDELTSSLQDPAMKVSEDELTSSQDPGIKVLKEELKPLQDPGMKVSKNELTSSQDPGIKVSKDELKSLQDPGMKVSTNDLNSLQYPSEKEVDPFHTPSTGMEMLSSSLSIHGPSSSRKTSVRMRPRIIRTVEEARDYISQSRNNLTGNGQPYHEAQVGGSLLSPHVGSPLDEEEMKVMASQVISEESQKLEYSTPDPTFVMKASEDLTSEKEGLDEHGLHSLPHMTDISADVELSENLKYAPVQTDCVEKTHELSSLSVSGISSSQGSTSEDKAADAKSLKAWHSWTEKNFQEFEPIVKKIGIGFQENYMLAKEKVQDQLSLKAEISELGFREDNEELVWMNNEGLREIVFRVRENELAGRDPFHMMDAEDQDAFFKGLENKVEKVNEKLLNLHEWVHSRVENVDYGTDGISLYDLPEKIIPRWKGPPPHEDPEFLNNFVEQRKASFTENTGVSHPATGAVPDSLQKSQETSSDSVLPSSGVTNLRKLSQNGASTNPRTVIEGSDGSTKAGKKSGKEHWQHTKKWSREFLEMYNTQTDPEIKSVMKDMGKDLDRWITDKEVQEVADLMSRIPKRKQRYIEKKLDKLKREMEMFGPQAVVAKYREYSEEKEEDYLWWLDLPFILCIELYTIEDNVQKVGFYSLEMAADLELEPKQYHVIAFEDPGDSKNLCYIIQAHMDMLGNGRAFVVAQRPKDAFQEAKANGFNVTVIRKGELQLNVDQTLEEVETEIIEIGSKMYHDKIMHERSVDMGALMRGIFGDGGTTKRRRSRRALRKPTKS